ncbi:MAG: hypothetical protein WDM80_11875 [Limisphaerales bacterium]
MKITEQQFQTYLNVIPPIIWAWIYTALKDSEAKLSLKQTLFDEKDQARDLTQPWIRNEVNHLISKFPEIRMAAEKCATDYYIRHSWRGWFPWNWKK